MKKIDAEKAYNLHKKLINVLNEEKETNPAKIAPAIVGVVVSFISRYHKNNWEKFMEYLNTTVKQKMTKGIIMKKTAADVKNSNELYDKLWEVLNSNKELYQNNASGTTGTALAFLVASFLTEGHVGDWKNYLNYLCGVVERKILKKGMN